MQKYELTVVMDTKVTPAKKKALGEAIAKLIKTLEGKIEKTEDWGEIHTGQLLHFILELESASAKSLAIKLNGEEAVVKHLIIKSEKLKVKS